MEVLEIKYVMVNMKNLIDAFNCWLNIVVEKIIELKGRVLENI